MKRTRRLLWVGVAASVGLQVAPCRAQTDNGQGDDCCDVRTAEPVPFAPDSVGQPPINDGMRVRLENGHPVLKPLGAPSVPSGYPTQSEFSTQLETESWSGAGIRVVRGSRQALLFNYTRGLKSQTEVAVNGSFQRLHLDVLGNSSDFGDTAVAFRKYFYNPERAYAPTIVLSAKAFLPTGSLDKGSGIGKLSFGPSILASRYFGANGRTLAYAGAGYIFVGNSRTVKLHDTYYAWVGGTTALSPRTMLQLELSHFISPFREDYTRFFIGPRFNLTPTRAVELGLKRELQADGKPTSLSLGYSLRF